MGNVEAQGMNSAYQNAQQAFEQDQANKAQAYSTGGQLGLGQEGANLNAFTGAQQASSAQDQARLAAFNSAMQGGQAEQGIQQQAWNAASQAGQNEQQIQMQGAQNFGNLANEQQNLGLNLAQATYGAGQFQNQVQWPYQMLNVGESALAITPYNTQNNVTLPQPNTAAQGLGAFATSAGALGSLFGTNKPSAYAGGAAA
jgi:hypothetical protein